MTTNGNKCGSCSMCCKLTAVPELGKPVNKWCSHFKAGHGCTIYDDRPESCRSFRCVWLNGALPDQLRPDKSKVIIERLPSGKTYLFLVNPGNESAWKKKPVQRVALSLVQARKWVVINVVPHVLIGPQDRPVQEVLCDIEATKALYGLTSAGINAPPDKE